jgi:hypothetical protein
VVAGGLVAVGLVAGLGIGYAVGRERSGVQEAEVVCLSATGVISCSDADGDPGDAEYWVPRDLAWTDPGGGIHVGGRPACLPPTGRGAEGPMELSWLTVELAGTSWKQAVGVRC